MTESNGAGPREPRAIVGLLGGHPARALGIDPSQEDDLGPWWIAAALLGERGPETRALAACRGLRAAGLGHPAALAEAALERIATILAAAGHPRPEISAARLARSARRLMEPGAGSLVEIAETSDGLEELGARLAGLGPGIGPATLHRFLTPLRDRFAAAGDLPLHPAAMQAARCLGWLDEFADPTDPGSVGALRARSTDTDWIDLEAALERLGSVACRRKNRSRCPLAAACGIGAG